jgi:S-adenosyl methyltransferase
MAEVTALFGSLELVPPGVVRLDRWQPGGPTPDTDDSGITAYGALGRKSWPGKHIWLRRAGGAGVTQSIHPWSPLSSHR